MKKICGLRLRFFAGLLLIILLGGFAATVPYDVVYGDIDSQIVLTYNELKDFEVPSQSVQSGRVVQHLSRSQNGAEIILKKGILPFKRIKTKLVPEQKVQLGGMPVGFAITTKGLIVVGNSGVETKDGKVDTAQDGDIKKGDIIISLGDESVESIADINRIVGACEGKELKIVVRRKGKELSSIIKPQLDSRSNTYRLGLWIQDSAAGIGTMTYIKGNNKHYGALGHPICDGDTGTELPVMDGNIYRCALLGVVKGQRGKPGELRGMFLKSSEPIGTVKKNNKFGVFGVAQKPLENPLYKEEVTVANRSIVKPGKATLVTTVDSQPEEFEIEIIKASYQKNKDHKSMVVRVTDKRLLEKTGGIVQGMSGSPILQNGKLVGGLTHVFINDPTRGYAVYLDWMYNEF